MKAEKIIKLKIGDELFKYQPLKGIWSYIVLGVRDYGDSVLYEIECQACNDHEKCRILVAQNDNQKSFHYVSIVNDDEEHEQYYWHIQNEYYVSKNDCKRQAYKKEVEYKENRIKELEAQLKTVKDSLTELKLLIDGCV